MFVLDTGCRLGEALNLESCNGKVVLAHPRHRTVDDDWVGHRWGLVRRDCNIADVNIHILRHTCASRLLERGVDLYTVSKWLGHSSVKVTERYAHLRTGALDRAAAALASTAGTAGTAGT